MKEETIGAVIISGGAAGTLADILLHGMDTLKTRLQGQLTSKSTKYKGVVSGYQTILREEGVRGFFGGFTASVTGSLFATSCYFGAYHISKQAMLDSGLNPTLCYFFAGGVADVFASAFYVPSEVLKTRLQLQGRFNNPYSLSAHNYKNTAHAFSSIYKKRGLYGLYYGWGATLLRDVPYSAIQFTIYESFKNFFKSSFSTGNNRPSERITDMVSGATAGSVAGGITTPLDVIKTYLQTQQRKSKESIFLNTELDMAPRAPTYNGIWSAFKGIHKQSGVKGLFSGVGVRMVWTGSQSMVMFLLYEIFMDSSVI